MCSCACPTCVWLPGENAGKIHVSLKSKLPDFVSALRFQGNEEKNGERIASLEFFPESGKKVVDKNGPKIRFGSHRYV